jgi:hypothetical protein
VSDASEFTVVARYQVSAGHGDEVATLLGSHISATRDFYQAVPAA